MVRFLRWLLSILVGAINGIFKLALAVVLILLVLLAIGLFKGDGLPGNIVLSLDLRQSIADSTPPTPFNIGQSAPTVMDIVLALDEAGRDPRVKGLLMQLGGGDLSIAQAEEIGAAIKRFRQTGKFAIAYSHGFLSAGLGDYLTAAAANEIWMQPKSPFSPAGTGGGEIFLRGLFDKIQAEPQIVKRADYKSAADMFMEKEMTGPDREQLTALMQSNYDSAVNAIALDRGVQKQALVSVLDADPQFSEDARKAKLVDRLAYDDDAEWNATKRAGKDAKLIKLADFLHARQRDANLSAGPHVALIEAAGDIVDGKADGGFGSPSVIASDDLSKAIRDASNDDDIKAIVLRVDSPGGSVSASDQILDAVRKAQKRGKPVVVSMGSLAASGGYYISASAAKIVAEPGTITGSIGVLTGKVSIGKSLGLIGVNAGQVSVGKNTLFDSPFTPFTDDQLANLNAQADAIYTDFMQKVSAGRKLPFAKVQEIAKGRVWSGTDAQARGLVDQLGGLWVAANDARQLAKIPAGQTIVLKRYPGQKSWFEALDDVFGHSAAGVRALEGLAHVLDVPGVRAVVSALQAAPQGRVELRAGGLPQPAMSR